MKIVEITKLKADPITEALMDANGKATPISGYIHSTSDEFIRISTNRGSSSHIECSKKDVLVAFESDEKTGKMVLLVASDAKTRVINHFKAHELNERKHCECYDGIGVAEARPLSSIHPLLAAAEAEIRRILAEVGTGPGARELRCAEAHHDSIINGGSVADADFTRDLCVIGIDL